MRKQIITAEQFFSAFSQTMFADANRISTEGIKLIKNFEGRSLTPYIDDDKSTVNRVEYSIGYGHQIKPGEEYLMQGITEQKAEDLLIKDLVTYTNAVNDTITVPLQQPQFDALVSYTYNIGTGAFKSGNLAKLINSGASSKTIETWWKSYYITAAGKPSTALVTRRAKEFDKFNTTDTGPIVYTASFVPTSKAGKIIFGVAAGLIILGSFKKN